MNIHHIMWGVGKPVPKFSLRIAPGPSSYRLTPQHAHTSPSPGLPLSTIPFPYLGVRTPWEGGAPAKHSTKAWPSDLGWQAGQKWARSHESHSHIFPTLDPVPVSLPGPRPLPPCLLLPCSPEASQPLALSLPFGLKLVLYLYYKNKNAEHWMNINGV